MAEGSLELLPVLGAERRCSWVNPAAAERRAEGIDLGVGSDEE
jgi:hypothetical protein